MRTSAKAGIERNRFIAKLKVTYRSWGKIKDNLSILHKLHRHSYTRKSGIHNNMRSQFIF